MHVKRSLTFAFCFTSLIEILAACVRALGTDIPVCTIPKGLYRPYYKAIKLNLIVKLVRVGGSELMDFLIVLLMSVLRRRDRLLRLCGRFGLHSDRMVYVLL